jgi:protein SCO1/2
VLNKRRTLQRLLACALLTGATAMTSGLVACSDSKPSFSSVDITGVDYAKGFEVQDHNGQVRHLTDFAGKVVLMFFGYTQCPDVCPTTMSEMIEIKKALGKDGDRLQVLFVTVDPERDTPELLKAYMENFDPSFLALRATPEKLVALTKDYKIYYKKVDGSTPTSYTMDHSAGSYIYDPQGRLRLFTRYGGPKEALTKDIQTLLSGA